MNDGTSYDLHPDETGESDIIKEAIDIKIEYEESVEHEVKTGREHRTEWDNGIKDEVTDDVYGNTNIEEIYIKSEPVDTSEFEVELESAAVAKTDSCDTSKTYCVSSTDDMSQYNYNTKIIITEEFDIKSECEDDDEYEESAAGQDIASDTSSSDPDASVSNNKFTQSSTSNECNICNKTFSQAKYLLQHKQVHSGEKQFTCDQCDKTFLRVAHLINHKRIHSGERPFTCELCNRTFLQIGHLISHKRIHSGERPFKCDQCNKSFRVSSTLIRHKRIHSREKPYKCEQCSIAFTDLSMLTRHRRIHSGEKPFKCDQCNKAFLVSSDLVRHKRIHSVEKPFKCDQCDKAFAESSNLIKHKRIHSGERPFKCDQCNTAFTELPYLNRHKRIHSVNASY